MPTLKPKAAPATTWDLVFGPATGTCDDFVVLGWSPDLDEAEKQRNVGHRGFTYVLRYQHPGRTLVGRVAGRAEALWQPPSGPILAVGEPTGHLTIGPSGVQEVAGPAGFGGGTGIWGPNEDHVFVCGPTAPAIFYRRLGRWSSIPLPEGARGLWSVCGFGENEVYFVGDAGLILHWDGQALQALPIPTTRFLTGLAPLDDRTMCVCGYQGTLLMGNRKGWRLVPTGTSDALLAIGGLDGKVYYGAEGTTWSFDGASPPVEAFRTRTRWVSALRDGVVLSARGQGWLADRHGALTRLDTTV